MAARVPVRQARTADFPYLAALEQAADTRFAEIGVEPLPAGPPEGRSTEDFEAAEAVLVVGDPPAGFALITLLDGHPHLEQLSVHPDSGRQGLGTKLVQAVVAWARVRGYHQITLTTFAEVPFNAPFYRSLGFDALPDTALLAGLAELRHSEARIGLDAAGPRVAMLREL